MDELPAALQHVLYFILFAVLVPILLSWYIDYGHWIRYWFDVPVKMETSHPAKL